MSICLTWFRNDLRLQDNPLLTQALTDYDAIVPLVILDDRDWETDAMGHRKTGAFRTRFLLESIENLRRNLKEAGGELAIQVGQPPTIIPEMVKKFEVDAVYTSKGVAHEELQREEEVEKAISIPISYFRQETLVHPEDVPFHPSESPDVFTQFRKQCEAYADIRPPLPEPKQIDTPLKASDPIPEYEDLGSEKPDTDNRAVLDFKGGEAAGLERLNYYIWESGLIKQYKKTRNGMIGGDYSSKFAPWLANGSLSPRSIYQAVKDFEATHTKNKSTYWLIFELLWRDFFRFLTMRYGRRLFYLSGLWNVQKTWDANPEWLERWKTGTTGIPFIDANMRELYYTGYMSNRGRQNVASFLAKDLNQDWRIGASWFESLLIDYDVYSNWGNWNYNAGVGSDPRLDRFFNIILQAKKYDKQAKFIKLWVPELQHLDAETIHDWHTFSKKEQQSIAPDYEPPIYTHRKWFFAKQA